MKSLDGINLVEFDSNLGAAYAAMLLAENGAHAIKVEPLAARASAAPRTSTSSTAASASLELDLDDPASQPHVADLIRWADIVVTGFTPARLKQLNLDPESIRRINPRAIALGVPPLGSRGPDADFDANDDLVAARGGITGSQWARSGNPVALVFPAASYSAGVMAATAAVSALLARARDGAGQAVEVSLLAGAFSLHTGGILRHEKMTTLYHGPQDPLGPIPVYRLFEAADGKYLFAACGNATFWGKFAIAIDRPDLVGDPRFENAPWGIAQEHWQPLKDIIEPIIRTRSRDEWLRILREADVPCAPVMSRHEFIDHPQTRALGIQMVRKGGTVNFFGGCAAGSKVQLDTNRLHYSEITLKATFHHTPETVRRAFNLIAEKKVLGNDYITGEAPLVAFAGRAAPYAEPQRGYQDRDYSGSLNAGYLEFRL